MTWRRPEPPGDLFALVLLRVLGLMVLVLVRALAPR
jgi:hypothetical protein